MNLSPTNQAHLQHDPHQSIVNHKTQITPLDQEKTCSAQLGPTDLLAFDTADPDHPPQNETIRFSSLEVPVTPLSSREEDLPAAPELAKGKAIPMFNNKVEKQEAINLHARNASNDEKKNLPPFSKYGLQFQPASGEVDVYRTILISNLQPSVTLFSLLDRVRGGVVLNAKKLDTTSITGNHSALITFVHEHAALAYKEYTAKHPIILEDVVIEVDVLTPTWPIDASFRKRILDNQMTRCLVVHKFPNDVSQTKLKNDLKFCPKLNTNGVLHRHLDQNGLLKLHFPSIAHADRAHWMFSHDKDYKTCTPYFVPDPCAQPMETLNERSSSSAVAIKSPWERMENGLEQKLMKYVKTEGENEFRCKVAGCGKLFRNSDSWRMHVKDRHTEWYRNLKENVGVVFHPAFVKADAT